MMASNAGMPCPGVTCATVTCFAAAGRGAVGCFDFVAVGTLSVAAGIRTFT